MVVVMSVLWTVPSKKGLVVLGCGPTCHTWRDGTGGLACRAVTFLQISWPESDPQVFPAIHDGAGCKRPQELLKFFLELSRDAGPEPRAVWKSDVLEVHLAQRTWHLAYWHKTSSSIPSEGELHKIIATGNRMVVIRMSVRFRDAHEVVVEVATQHGFQGGGVEVVRLRVQHLVGRLYKVGRWKFV